MVFPFDIGSIDPEFGAVKEALERVAPET